MSNKRFIQVFFFAFFALLLFIGAANYIVDPYGLHFHTRYEGFNKHKPEFLNYTRVAKLYNADIIQPQGLFLGNSRILYLAPEQAFRAYKPYDFYNFSLSSGTINEMNDLLAYSIRNYDIKYVCYSIDFIAMLSWTTRYASNFDKELVDGRKSKLIEFIKLHTSTQAIDKSIHCIKTNRSDPEGKYVKYHYNEFGSRTNKWREINYADLGEAWLRERLEFTLNTYKDIYNHPQITIPDYKKEAYLSILEQCKDHNIEYTAFMSPIYKDQFIMLITSPAYDLYIEYLRFLAQNGGIWYFGGINEVTGNTNLYWDSQHPRKAMSTILAEIMFKPSHTQFTDALFGTYYTSENIDSLISSLDKIRKELLATTEEQAQNNE